jgi:hypothetical protein
MCSTVLPLTAHTFKLPFLFRASKLSLHLLSPLDGYDISYTFDFKHNYDTNHFNRVDRTADLPMLFFLDPYEAVHNLPSCNDKDIYVSCTKISINIDLLRDKSVFQILLPDGTVLDRSENHDAGAWLNLKGKVCLST